MKRVQRKYPTTRKYKMIKRVVSNKRKADIKLDTKADPIVSDINPFKSYAEFLAKWEGYVKNVSETYNEIVGDLARKIGSEEINKLSDEQIEAIILKDKNIKKGYRTILFIFNNLLTKIQPPPSLSVEMINKMSYEEKVNHDILRDRYFYYEQFPDLITPDSVVIYRAITEYKKEDINLDRVGQFWSWHRGSAEPYAGNVGTEYIIVAVVDKHNVNWEESIVRNTDPLQGEEREVYLDKGTPIKIIDVAEVYSYLNDKGKWSRDHPKGYEARAD